MCLARSRIAAEGCPFACTAGCSDHPSPPATSRLWYACGPEGSMKGKLGLALLGAGVVIAVLVASSNVCVSYWLNHDLSFDECPSGTMRLTAHVTAGDLQIGRASCRERV